MIFDLHPKVGIGHLKLGMTPADVASFYPVYGQPAPDAGEPFIFEFSASEIESMRKEIGEAALKTILDALEVERNYKQALITKFLPQYGLRLDFHNGALGAIQVSRQMGEFNFLQNPFFYSSPRLFLAELEVINAEPPLVKGLDCVFRNLNIYVWAAFETIANGVARFLTETEELSQDKSLILRASPRNETEDFSEHAFLSFR